METLFAIAGLIFLLRIEYAHHRSDVNQLAIRQLAERSLRIDRGYYLCCSNIATPEVHGQDRHNGKGIASDQPRNCLPKSKDGSSDDSPLPATSRRHGTTHEDHGG